MFDPGLEETQDVQGLSVYPNPFTEEMQINGAGEYAIYNMEGVQLEKGDCKVGKNLPVGMYVLELRASNNVKRLKISNHCNR